MAVGTIVGLIVAGLLVVFLVLAVKYPNRF
ncbi:K(+)-transporting ATPase subunit F [Kitasatospora purpeofusca]|nr:K(+)-transporting ATPase subunit F [Kitasatospora purpeofusca]WSR37841.1 K(+)-transporting ATPase subunit F [Kitasatospora purpeofusca]